MKCVRKMYTKYVITVSIQYNSIQFINRIFYIVNIKNTLVIDALSNSV